MKYNEIDFTLAPCTQDAQDVLAAMAGEMGCESFEESPSGLRAYIQQQLYTTEALEEVVQDFPFLDTIITYKVREAEDRDWNEQWEQEGFEPIIIRGERREKRGEGYDCIVIHDGCHLPTLPSRDTLHPSRGTHHPSRDTLHPSRDSSLSPLYIEIDAHMAFGTGTHETTRMICSALMTMNLDGQHVLDCGCGTGILGICALKLGAVSSAAYDIDEWSADNTRHNAVINQVDNRLQPLCGDSSVLSGYGAEFDLVMANINRNILLADMPRFVSVMAPHSTLILSGFYETDCALLESKAQQLGLRLTATKTDSNWACMVLNTP